MSTIQGLPERSNISAKLSILCCEAQFYGTIHLLIRHISIPDYPWILMVKFRAGTETSRPFLRRESGRAMRNVQKLLRCSLD